MSLVDFHSLCPLNFCAPSLKCIISFQSMDSFVFIKAEATYYYFWCVSDVKEKSRVHNQQQLRSVSTKDQHQLYILVQCTRVLTASRRFLSFSVLLSAFSRVTLCFLATSSRARVWPSFICLTSSSYWTCMLFMAFSWVTFSSRRVWQTQKINMHEHTIHLKYAQRWQ